MSPYFKIENGVLIFKRRYETIRIEAWGKNALRVRATQNHSFTAEDWALSEPVSETANAYMESRPTDYGFEMKIGVIENGTIRAEMTEGGRIRFLNSKGEILLEEHYNAMGYYVAFNGEDDWINGHQYGRKYRTAGGDNYKIRMLFKADDSEMIFGMGQYQQKTLNLKGTTLELRQINTQASVPFYVSNKGYGFLMNNPAIGQVSFGTNMTEWNFESTKQIDYWVTAGDTPAQIEEQ